MHLCAAAQPYVMLFAGSAAIWQAEAHTAPTVQQLHTGIAHMRYAASRKMPRHVLMALRCVRVGHCAAGVAEGAVPQGNTPWAHVISVCNVNSRL